MKSFMKCGLIGKSLVHSYSKEIHEALKSYSYELFSLTEDEVAPFINTGDFTGLNVTIPYKQDVIPLCDEISPLAAEIGAVNTLYWKSDSSAPKGKILVGHNTDYEGFLYTAKRASIEFSGKTILILGTGGTSLMVRKAISDEGAAKIYIASRRAFENKASGDMITYDKLPSIANTIEIIINATPVGTYPANLKSVIDISDFPACEAVIDVIYNPFSTKLLLDAKRAGLKTANGLPMLVAQATAAAGYFVGKPGAFEMENEKIIKRLSFDMANFVLIGMPGSGKTSLGRLLAKTTGKTFIDMDDEIVKTTGKTIPEIFDDAGEAAFRDIESEVAFNLGKQKGLIIATGGGCVMRDYNIDCLKQNGLLVHIKRPLSQLATKGRPLSKSIEALQEMESTRMPIYERVSDITAENISTPTSTVDKILQLIDDIYV